MDEVSKYRLTGAIVWLLLLVVFVPIWFGEPVNFRPEGYVPPEKSAERPLLEEVLVKEAPQKENRVAKASKKQWIVRVIAYKDMKDANDLLGRLEVDYEVMIKSFEKNGMHSVRVGPYFSKAKAEQAKQKLDKMLHTQAEVVQLNITKVE